MARLVRRQGPQYWLSERRSTSVRRRFVAVHRSLCTDRTMATGFGFKRAKHTIRGLNRSAAIEFGSRGVRVNELQPGVIDTEMTQANPEGTQRVADTGIPMRRVDTG